MKLLKIAALSIVMGFAFIGITDQFSSSKYPSCELVSKGIGVSTYGCSNMPSNTPGYNEPCNELAPDSPAMSTCINDNYYKYKTFPFGFKQIFGEQSNLNDPKPKRNNEYSSFVLGFVLTALVSVAILHRKTKVDKRVQPI